MISSVRGALGSICSCSVCGPDGGHLRSGRGWARGAVIVTSACSYCGLDDARMTHRTTFLKQTNLAARRRRYRQCSSALPAMFHSQWAISHGIILDERRRIPPAAPRSRSSVSRVAIGCVSLSKRQPLVAAQPAHRRRVSAAGRGCIASADTGHLPMALYQLASIFMRG